MEDIGSIIGIVIYIAIIVFLIAALWRVFTKAGQPGFLAIIPIVNIFILIQIAGKPWWWFLLLLIPFVNFVIIILVWHGVSTNFGKGAGFTIGLLLLSPIFLPLLAFGDAQYQGQKAKAF